MQWFQGWKRWMLMACAVGALGVPAMAKVLCTKVTVFIVGADSYGCPSWGNGACGSGKITKDPHTGILVEIGSVTVRNDSGCSQCYSDLGYCIYDPWCGSTWTATSDSTSLTKPIKCKSLAGLTACFNPNCSGDSDDEEEEDEVR